MGEIIRAHKALSYTTQKVYKMTYTNGLLLVSV